MFRVDKKVVFTQEFKGWNKGDTAEITSMSERDHDCFQSNNTCCKECPGYIGLDGTNADCVGYRDLKNSRDYIIPFKIKDDKYEKRIMRLKSV